MNIYKSMSHVSQGMATKFPLYLTHIPDQPEMAAHSHEFVEIVYVESGTAVQKLNYETINLKKGDFFGNDTDRSNYVAQKLYQSLYEFLKDKTNHLVSYSRKFVILHCAYICSV